MIALLATILGIGLLLLLHEAGHYWAARAAGIRVEVFSLGFGPRLFGWTRGECDFRLAAIPLGGYVKVSGEEPGQQPRPGDLFYATPLQRLLFYSGGILMNFLFAFLMVPILFWIGVPFEAPLVGTVEAGSAAWHAGIRPGERILEVNGKTIHGFRNISANVALGAKGEEMQMLVRDLDGQERTVSLVPDYDEKAGLQGIGLGPMMALTAAPGSATEEALGTGIRLLQLDGIPVSDPLLLAAILERENQRDQSLEALYSVDGEERSATLKGQLLAQESRPLQLGIRMLADEVEFVQGALAQSLQVGDRLLRLDGKPIAGVSSLMLALAEAGRLGRLEFERDGRRMMLEEWPPLQVADLSAQLSLRGSSDQRYGVTPGGPADQAGLRDGCRILRIGDRATPSFADLREALRAAVEAGDIEGLALTWVAEDSEEPQQLQLDLAHMPLYDFGLAVELVQETVRSPSPIVALRMGAAEARRMIGEVLTTVQRMVTGEIASRNLGGIITIGTVTHNFAGQGLIPLLFFLCMISANLGVLNLLPIPALDGGHILFLLFEMIARRPAPALVQNIFQVVGVFVVLGLLIYVTMMDISRLMG